MAPNQSWRSLELDQVNRANFLFEFWSLIILIWLARGRSIWMIIGKRQVHLDDLLQEASLSRWPLLSLSTGHDEDDANDHTEYAGSSVCWVANSGLIRNSAGSSLAAVLSSLSMVRYGNLQLIYSMVQCSPAYPQLWNQKRLLRALILVT